MADQLYVYGIIAEPVAVADLVGIAGRNLRVVSQGACHAVVEPVAAAPTPSPDTLRAQDRLVRALADRAAALLPARFGSRFPDDAALRQALDDLTPRLVPALTQVRDREQMTIRLFGRPADMTQDSPAPNPPPEPPEVPETPGPGPATMPGGGKSERVFKEFKEKGRAESAPGYAAGYAAGYPAGHPAGHVPQDNRAATSANAGPGTTYLRQRAAQARHFPIIVDLLRGRVADLVTAERIERGQPPLIASIHHLIPRGAAEAYHAAVRAGDALDAGGDDIRLRVSGPSPAYAFTEADLP